MGRVKSLQIYRSYLSRNFHTRFVMTGGSTYYSQPMGTLGSEPQVLTRPWNTKIPDQPIATAWSSVFPTSSLPELKLTVSQSPKCNYIQYPSHMAANLRDHSRDHFNIKVYHQVAPKGVFSNRQSENKPQIANACWIDGCAGKTFSNFSNLLRHQREQHGKSDKVSCALCGSEFTRTSARNIHQRRRVCSRVEEEQTVR